ncbi:biotin/lipoate--protein ligase family protein [Seohaeicola saemankumensis]|uniref:Biotin/lipoate--protein ligase family protein n=1 Tax=Seohaeicola saemankumensis TaxID=481181 RepID=A0ABW3T7Q6_9RHOB
MLDNHSAPRALVLPPPYAAHWLAQGDTQTKACVMAPEHGAGTLVWHCSQPRDGRRPSTAGRFDFAVVLEPDVPLIEARKAFVLGMLALGDALAAHCPPERAVSFGWPGEVRLDAGRLGGMRLHLPDGVAEDEVPDWMVLGVELIADRDNLTAPGSKPDSVSLKEEDFTDPPAILESFAAYLMLNFDRMAHGGYEALALRYGERLAAGGTMAAAVDLRDADGLARLGEALHLTPWRDDTGPRL